MADEQTLWRAILAEPGSVPLRLALGAVWGGDREAFIQAQVETSDLMRAGRDFSKAALQADRFLAGHERAWAGPIADRVDTVRFLRGFVEWIVVDAATFVRDWKALFELAPIRHVDAGNVGPIAAEFFACEGLERLAGLSLNLYGTRFGRSRLGDAGAHALAASERLRRLRYLDVRQNDLSEDALAEIAASPALPRLEVGLLDGNAVPDLHEEVGQDYDGTITDIRPSEALYAFEQRHGARRWLHPCERKGRRVLREEI